jgi:hypothetical protein
LILPKHAILPVRNGFVGNGPGETAFQILRQGTGYMENYLHPFGDVQKDMIMQKKKKQLINFLIKKIMNNNRDINLITIVLCLFFTAKNSFAQCDIKFEKRLFILLLLGILIISCGEESENLLTAGEWTAVSAKETVKFNDDNTYIIKTELITSTTTTYLQGQIWGNWKQQSNFIIFVNQQVYLPDDKSFAEDDFVNDGKPVNSFFGYVYDHWEGNSRPLVSTGIDDKSIPMVWSIKKLTQDSLSVEFNGEILKYYHEYKN